MTKRALLIGIDEYADPAVPDLHGCRNDVEAMAAVLVDGYGFAPANLVKLVDPQRTRRQSILNALSGLADQTEDGDVALVYYSGHGSQVPDRDGDEKLDRLDETIVPSDSGRAPGWPILDIVDDELETYVGALAQRTPYTYFVFDSCHSGSVTRDLLELETVRKARQEQQPAPRAIPAAAAPLAVDAQPFLDFERPETRRKSATGLIPQGEYLMIAGCLDEETSGEMEFDGVSRGLLSYHLVDGLRSADGSTVEEIFAKAKASVEEDASRNGDRQQPVLEGPAKLKGGRPFEGASGQNAVRAEGAEEKGGEEPPGNEGGGAPAEPQTGDGGKGGSGGGKPGEWDGGFAAVSAGVLLGLLALVGAALGLLTWLLLDGEADPADVVTTLAVEFLFVGLVLGMAGAYIALLNLRGRMQAVGDALKTGATTQQRIEELDTGTKGLPNIPADLVKSVTESIGKMPTARALVVVGGLIVGGAIAFAWDVVPGQLTGYPPKIEKQPASVKARPGAKAQFAVSASGEDLRFTWKRNGKAIPWAGNSPSLTIAPITKADRNDLFAVVVRNEQGVATSDAAKLELLGKKQAPGAGRG